ncbi:hypothetical protein UVI_02003430 [Ustilaginoidea virens]|uniref:Dihydroxy-acid dehydratase n=1 Tax=Ustilaginoidea virens TaxID=1159556 RepID=A0A1B5L130_USTVR|nr:hypothetical protein UVI_02003430 [Ustilaginoidea virens]
MADLEKDASTATVPVPGPDAKSSPDYIQFDCLPPGGPLNRWSAVLTREHDFPGAQAMLYGAGVPNEQLMKNAPQVGIATVWWEGNPCK